MGVRFEEIMELYKKIRPDEDITIVEPLRRWIASVARRDVTDDENVVYFSLEPPEECKCLNETDN